VPRPGNFFIMVSTAVLGCGYYLSIIADDILAGDVSSCVPLSPVQPRVDNIPVFSSLVQVNISANIPLPIIVRLYFLGLLNPITLRVCTVWSITIFTFYTDSL